MHGAGRTNGSNPTQKMERSNSKAWTNVRYKKGGTYCKDITKRQYGSGLTNETHGIGSTNETHNR